MQCELCGKITSLVIAMVEGTQLKVCANCGRFGKVLKQAAPNAAERRISKPQTMITESIVPGYATLIRTAREKRGLTQQDFAKLTQIKESLLHKLETNNFEPPIDIARKLERALHIKLVETKEEGLREAGAKEENRPSGMTIGDILKR